MFESAGGLRSGRLQTAQSRLQQTLAGFGKFLSQAFVRRFGAHGPFATLVPGGTKDPLTFAPTHPDAAVALPWMAVLIANDRPPKKALKVHWFGGHPNPERAITSSSGDSRVIEG